MKLRSCNGCGVFTEDKRCPDCEAKRPKRASFRERYPDWPKIKAAVIKRDHRICHWCGVSEPKMTADHLIPRSKGGTHELDNLVCACQFCNHNRNNLSVSKWVSSPILAQRRQEVSSAKRSRKQSR